MTNPIQMPVASSNANQDLECLACPYVAAFEAGQHTNRIAFHTKQAWFLDEARQAQFASSAYDDLALTALGLGLKVDVRERLSARIVQSQADWNGWFKSGSRIDDALQSHEADEAEIQGLIHRNAAREEIAPLLNESALMAFYLGEHVDKGQHPEEVIAEIVADYNQEARRSMQNQAEGLGNEQIPRPPCHRSFLVTARHPTESWYRSLWLRCDQLGLQCDFAGVLGTEWERDEARSVQDRVAGISNVIREAIRVRFRKEPVAVGGIHDLYIQPSPLEITITMGDRLYALVHPRAGSFSLSRGETDVFGLFVSKAIAGQPHEVVQWNEINSVFLNEEAKQCNSAAKFFSQFNKRLSDWLPLPNGEDWFCLHKGEGRFLNRSIAWRLDETNEIIKDMMKSSSSVTSIPTNPHTMAKNSKVQR